MSSALCSIAQFIAVIGLNDVEISFITWCLAITGQSLLENQQSVKF